MHNILGELDGTGLRRKNRKFIKSYERQKVVESHDRIRLQRTQHIKKIIFSASITVSLPTHPWSPEKNDRIIYILVVPMKISRFCYLNFLINQNS